MAQEWNIRPRGHHCQDCRKPFAEGEPCHSALQDSSLPEGAAPGLERIDRCRACWRNLADGAPPIAWQSLYHAPEPPAPDPAPRQTVETLLRRLMEGEDAMEHAAAIYILAVMLERKKLLIERDVRPQGDGQLLRVYEHRKTGEVLLVPDPGLQMEALEEVQAQVVRLLSQPDGASVATPSGEADQHDAGKDQANPGEAGPGEGALDPAH